MCFLVGMGVGGEFGIGMVIVIEIWFKEMCVKVIFVVVFGW